MYIPYTNQLSAEDLIRAIAWDRPELSHDKVYIQRDGYIRACKAWLECNVPQIETIPAELNSDF